MDVLDGNPNRRPAKDDRISARTGWRFHYRPTDRRVRRSVAVRRFDASVPTVQVPSGGRLDRRVRSGAGERCCDEVGQSGLRAALGFAGASERSSPTGER